MPISFSNRVRASTDHIAEGNQELNKQGGWVSLSVGLDEPKEVPSQAVVSSLSKRFRPGWSIRS